MKRLEFISQFLHPQFHVVERITKEIEKQIKMLEIQELHARRDYLEHLSRYNKILLKLRELEVAKGTTANAELRRRERIRLLRQKLVVITKPVEPDLSQFEAQRLLLEAKLMDNMKINSSLLAAEAVRSKHLN